MKKKLFNVVALLSLTTFITGCDSIFVKDQNPYEQVKVTKEELENDIYYIKDGTKFIQTHQTKFVTVTIDNIDRKILYLGKDIQTIPTLYKGEILAVASNENMIDKVDVVRYKELGYSLAAYGLVKDSDGYYCGITNGNIIEGSSLYEYMKENAKSQNIRFLSLNDVPLHDNMLTRSGLFYGLEYGKNYTFDYYSGTSFNSGSAVADIFALEEFEYYQLTDSEITKNGYVEFKMPEDAKSGWYAVNNTWLFKYINQEKGIDTAAIDMNEEYYSESVLKEDIYAQKYSVTFDVRLMDVEVSLPYYTNHDINENTIVAKLYSPDKTFYSMNVDMDKNIISCMLDEAMAGKWTIYVEPKELQLSDVKVVSSEYQQEITKEEHSLQITEEKINALFEVSYEGNGTIYGILITPSGNTYTLEDDKENHKLSYSIPYAETGDYQINIYHYTDTNILNINVEKNTKTDSEIIVVSD